MIMTFALLNILVIEALMSQSLGLRSPALTVDCRKQIFETM
jgi:hypothetical protein